MAVIGELLRHRARLSPDLEAIVSGSERITYREYNKRVNQLAHYFQQNQIGKGDRIAILCKNSHPFPLIYMAAAKIGAITVPINWRIKTDDIRYILEDCSPSILFYDGDFEQVLPLVGELPFLKQSICVDKGGKIQAVFSDIFAETSAEEPKVDVLESDPAILIYTSGTTGRPKGVVSSHANIFAGSISNTTTLDLRQKDRFLFVTPLFHISGMMFMVGALLRGLTLVLSTQFHPVKIWDFINAERITGMMSVPSMLSFMYEVLKTQDVDVPSLRMILCGGSKVPETIIQQMDELGYGVAQVYGATEYTGAITYWTPDMGLDYCASAGKAVYLTELKIIDPTTGETLPLGEVGEVVCRGPLTFSGYWNQPEETEKVLRKGWYHTQDVGWMDEHGFLYIVDRLRDMIITSGENVFPAQVEATLLKLEEVAEVAVVGVKHSVWGELARAYVVRKEGAAITEEEILEYAHKHLPIHYLHEVVFIDELPKNGMGKVMKYMLREHANKEQLAN